MMCTKVKVIVDDLKKQHGASIQISTIKLGTPEAKKAVKDAGLKLHGIIAKDAQGKIVKTVEGHSYGKPKVEKVIKQLKKG